MHESIAAHAEGISKAATSARTLVEVAEKLRADVDALCELAATVSSDVKATSIPTDVAGHMEDHIAFMNKRIVEAKEAEEKAFVATRDLESREAAVAAREKAAGEIEADLTERMEKVRAAEAALVKDEADGHEQSE